MSDNEATQRLKNFGGISGEHHWRNLLGDAVASIGDRQGNLEDKMTEVRLKLEHQLTRVEVSKIAQDANKPLEAKLGVLMKLVFGVLLVIILAIGGDVLAWAHRT